MLDVRKGQPGSVLPFDAKWICEEFARLKGYRLKLMKIPWADRWYVRIRYGRYCLKYFDGTEADSPAGAYDFMAKQLCDPDEYFDPCNFKGWSHFGRCSGEAELVMKIAIAGGV